MVTVDIPASRATLAERMDHLVDPRLGSLGDFVPIGIQHSSEYCDTF